MTSLLLIISFLLHVIMLIAIFQLYRQIEQLKQEKNESIETTMQQFINEIKVENHQLQQQLSQTSRPSSSFSPVEQGETTTHSDNKELNEKHPKNDQTTNDELIDITDMKQEKMELSLEGKILQLHEAGYNVEQIAEQLTCGKTEVELILNLQQQLRQKT